MGLIARILDSFKGDENEPAAKVEVFKNDNLDARIFNPPGVDAGPIDGDVCFTEDSEDTEGGKDILGFIDPKNEPVAEKGEYRVYSRDSNGDIAASFHMKSDGSINMVAPGGFNITGDLKVTGKINATGIIKSDVDVEGPNIKLESHTHIANMGADTAPPTVGALTPIGSPIVVPDDLDMNSKEVLNIGSAGTSYSTHGHEQSNDSDGNSEQKTEVPS